MVVISSFTKKKKLLARLRIKIGGGKLTIHTRCKQQQQHKSIRKNMNEKT